MRCVLAILASLLPCAAAAAARTDDFEQQCMREMRPVLEVTTRDPVFSVSDRLSARLLSARLTNASVNQGAFGMTAATSRTEVMFDAPSLMDAGRRRECVAPHVYVELAYQQLEVHVAREFHRLSCAYRTVYEHEMQHVAIYRQSLAVVEQHVREALVERYGDRPLFGAPGAGSALLERDVDEWLRPLIKKEMAEGRLRHALLDSPEEAYRLGHACMGEVQNAFGIVYQ